MIYEFAWMKVRKDFNRLVTFCQIVDGALSGIVLLSISGNIFFVIVQLQSLALM